MDRAKFGTTGFLLPNSVIPPHSFNYFHCICGSRQTVNAAQSLFYEKSSVNYGSNVSIVGVYKVEKDELPEYAMACTRYLFSSGCRGWSLIVICHLVIAVNPGCMQVLGLDPRW
jgi:hypothetical protein